MKSYFKKEKQKNFGYFFCFACYILNNFLSATKVKKNYNPNQQIELRNRILGPKIDQYKWTDIADFGFGLPTIVVTLTLTISQPEDWLLQT